ncbi:MAG: hypothetical protein ACD_28C00214G0001, partial [uncultured bacterium]
SSDQPISVLSGSTDTVFVSWIPQAGTQTISITIYPWDTGSDNSDNNRVTKEVYVDYDTDGDGVGNTDDTDDDNDGHNDGEDDFPTDGSEWKDTDGDGQGNNTDTDDDNDGTPDDRDEMPTDFNETDDTDGDGIGNNTDTDDDGDGLSDDYETLEGTDPINNDTDEDGCEDGEDAFPGDPSECMDFDNDGTGDNSDPNDDNDDLKDNEDSDDHNAGPTIDISGVPIFPLTGHGVTFDASSSYDEDGEVESYEWIQNGEIVSEENTFEIAYDNKGLKTLELTVIDNKGESRTQEITIRIYSPSFFIGLGLLLVILLSLAFYTIFRYSPRAEMKKMLSKSKKTAKKKSIKKS